LERRATAPAPTVLPPPRRKHERPAPKHLDEALLAALQRVKADTGVQPGIPFN
jgi:hypothetical protein